MSFIITPTDPLALNGPERTRELWRAFSAACGQNKYTLQEAAEASMAMVCSCIRQGCETRAEAERRYDELSARIKGSLLEKHYDAVTGKRRSTFAWDQTVEMPVNDFRDKY